MFKSTFGMHIGVIPCLYWAIVCREKNNVWKCLFRNYLCSDFKFCWSSRCQLVAWQRDFKEELGNIYICLNQPSLRKVQDRFIQYLTDQSKPAEQDLLCSRPLWLHSDRMTWEHHLPCYILLLVCAIVYKEFHKTDLHYLIWIHLKQANPRLRWIYPSHNWLNLYIAKKKKKLHCDAADVSFGVHWDVLLEGIRCGDWVAIKTHKHIFLHALKRVTRHQGCK